MLTSRNPDRVTQKVVTHCYLCSTPLQNKLTWRRLLIQTVEPVICEKCMQKFVCVTQEQQKYEDVTALYHYNEPMKDFLHQYKFFKDVVLSEVFHAQIHNYLKDKQAIIVPIPMHPDKLKQRTFAHIDEILNAANISYTHLLEKKSPITQSSKSKVEREQSEQLFNLKPHSIIEAVHYILVDDIVTTGTTLKYAKSLLLEAGAKKVTAFTLIQG
ncbi:ComF family protein [Rummeliibacillus sp. NPDC094406]|uniref:ComF family protein n=1 Tax=Rummeliibacillus sp. NPDC094406 TaxID=3364511 RepID=UPI0037F92E03